MADTLPPGAGPPSPPHPDWYYRCPRCRREQPATSAEVTRHLYQGWPRCCGEPMSLHARPRPAADPA